MLRVVVSPRLCPSPASPILPVLHSFLVLFSFHGKVISVRFVPVNLERAGNWWKRREARNTASIENARGARDSCVSSLLPDEGAAGPRGTRRKPGNRGGGAARKVGRKARRRERAGGAGAIITARPRPSSLAACPRPLRPPRYRSGHYGRPIACADRGE